jgi:hypothetical protein
MDPIHRFCTAHTIERVQIKSSLGPTLPESQVVGGLGAITGDHNVERDSDDFLTPCPDSASGTVTKALRLSVEADLVGHVQTRELRSYRRRRQR